MTDIHIIPVLNDNYSYIIRHGDMTTVVDPGEALPLEQFLRARQWSLDYILLTHHHGDHIGGTAALKKNFGASIVAPASEISRIPGIDIPVEEGGVFLPDDLKAQIIETPGHTRGHIAFYLPEARVLFCGDTLFSMGCGRVFEGTMEEMWTSLQKLSALPDDTQIYCGHEYTEANGRFALSVEPGNPDVLERMNEATTLRAAGKPTIPVTLATEKKTNPFLRAASAERFAELRQMKDRF